MMYLNSYRIRHSIAVTVALVSAFLISKYFSFSHESWILLATLIVCQTTPGTPLRQGLLLFVVSATTVIAAAFIQSMHFAVVTEIILCLVFIIASSTLYLYAPLSRMTIFLLLIIPLLFVVAIISPGTYLLRARILDIAIGSFIGILSIQIIFRVQLAQEFSQGILPILNALNQLTQAISENFLQGGMYSDVVLEKQNQVELILHSSEGMYPAWVYEIGFNPGLRSGFRFFLVNLERAIEVYFSVDSVLSHLSDTSLPQDLAQAMAKSMQKNSELVEFLIQYFQFKKIIPTDSDFTQDIKELEKILQYVVPNNLEALDISPNYLRFTVLVRDIKDLRGLLLQLVMAV